MTLHVSRPVRLLMLCVASWQNLKTSHLFCAQTPTFNSTLKGRVLLDLFTEPDIFGIKWDALNQYNGVLYPALPDLYGPTMNVRYPWIIYGHAPWRIEVP